LLAYIKGYAQTNSQHEQLSKSLLSLHEEAQKLYAQYTTSDDDDGFHKLHEALQHTARMLLQESNPIIFKHKLTDYQTKAQSLAGESSVGWKLLGTAMLGVAAALGIVGGLALGGVLTISTAGVAPALIGVGAAALLFSTASFVHSRQKGLSRAASDFADALKPPSLGG